MCVGILARQGERKEGERRREERVGTRRVRKWEEKEKRRRGEREGARDFVFPLTIGKGRGISFSRYPLRQGGPGMALGAQGAE